MASDHDPDDLPEVVSRRVAEARRAPNWSSPPDDVVGGLLASPGRPPVPPSQDPQTEWKLDWEVTDVRSAAVGAGGPRLLTHVFEDGELALTADPPQGDHGWQIRGTVWIRDSSDGPVNLLLLVEDHVVVTATATSGEAFLLEEFLPPGWSLEVHLPNGKCVVVIDPGVG